MPSLRQKMTTYFRQLSFVAEPRETPRTTRRTEDDSFILKYLEGRKERMFMAEPEVFNGKTPTDLPAFNIGTYPTGPDTITAACTGPDEGLTGIKRSKLHLSASLADDIDFIDTSQEYDFLEVRNSINPNKTNGHLNDSKKSYKITSLRKSSCHCLEKHNSDHNANKPVYSYSSRHSKQTLCHSGTCAETENYIEQIQTCIVKTDSSLRTDSDVNSKSFHVGNGDDKAVISKVSVCDDSTSTENLLRDAVLNRSGSHDIVENSVAGVSNWKSESESAYGISVSLYEINMLTKEAIGNPIADCYGIVVRDNVAVMALADGVNWGDGARLAARSAVHGSLDYLDRALFGVSPECSATTTEQVFVSLLRSIWEGHGCILEVGGALSTLSVAVVLPLSEEHQVKNETEKYVVCACNVGDSLGYVYSKKHGVREFTLASHDITSMRDMRDALGALGPADGNKPELSNLTFSMTKIEHGDIVFLTSDGISDNFDPVVGKFAEAWTPNVKLQNASKPVTSTNKSNFGMLAPKRQNKSTSHMLGPEKKDMHLASTPVRPPRSKKPVASVESIANNTAPSRPKYMRSHTVIETRHLLSEGTSSYCSPNRLPISKVPISITTGLPLVTGPQRHALTLYRLEDLLSYGINGTFCPCGSARRLCHLLIDFARMITSARRKTLEQRELFYKMSTGADGIKREIELNRLQHRAVRKRIVDSSAFTALPGKLDHATVVAYTVGKVPSSSDSKNKNGFENQIDALDGESTKVGEDAAQLQLKEFKETNF